MTLHCDDHYKMIDTDVLVIGGGIAGLSLAAALSPRARVVLLEKESQLFVHTSGRSARQSQPTYGPAPIRRFTAATLDRLLALEADAGRLLTSRPLVWLDLAGAAPQIDALLPEIAGLERITERDAVARFPALRPEAIAGAALDPASVEVNVDLLKEHLAARVAAAGGSLALGREVVGATRDGGAWNVHDGNEVYRAPVVVIAAGPWADAIGRVFHAREHGLIPTRRTVVVATARGRSVDPRSAMVMDAGGSFYLRPAGTGFLASSLEDEPSVAEDARPRPEIVQRTLEVVNRVTELELGQPLRSWTGLRTLSPDGLPVIGWDGSADGVYWLAGQGGYGIQTSLGLADAVAADLLGDGSDAQVTADLAAFDPRRSSR